MAESQESTHITIDHIARSTLCLPNFQQDAITHAGDDGFSDALKRYFVSPENNASERLVALKSRLRSATTYDFWSILTEEICDIFGSQCGFVAKRMLVDDSLTAVEMPPLGEPGSCLMGVAFYVNDGQKVKNLYRDYQYHAYGTPCAYMKHDKVFIVPERMMELLPNNPNASSFPWKVSDAYIGIPLFAEGKCFAHFGMIWSAEGNQKRNLGWGYIEVFMHALEDLVAERILAGRSFAKDPEIQENPVERVIPLDAITAAQSLKPYARSLSHELRTPMQGVVGMLDIMYSAVLEGIDTQRSEKVKAVFRELKENIEQAQDSSKRAVEAADNVVHAYDLEMRMPETPLATPTEQSVDSRAPSNHGDRPGILVEGAGITGITSLSKRKRSADHDYHPGPPLKRLAQDTESDLRLQYRSADPLESISSSEPEYFAAHHAALELDHSGQPLTSPPMSFSNSIVLGPTHRHINTRDFIQRLVSDALLAGHPIRKVHVPTDTGETIEVRTKGMRDEYQDKLVVVSVEADVPEVIISEESVLGLAITKVVDNAVKFTESGKITVLVRLSQNLLEIRVSDTGCGITPEGQAQLFKPFSQQDSSLTREKEGLGMGLFVAKGRVRGTLGGDMSIVRSAIQGPEKGTEFLIRLPITSPSEDGHSPPVVGTPTPSHRETSRTSPYNTSPQRTRPDSVNCNFSYEDKRTHQIKVEDIITPAPVRSEVPSGLSDLHTRTPEITFLPNSQERIVRSPIGKAQRRGYNPRLGIDHPLTILVAEDNSINRKILSTALRRLGYPPTSILMAFDGQNAVELYAASLKSPNPVDIILMDLWMPRMNGYDATLNIFELAHRAGRKLAVSAVTADITSESQARAAQVGMEGFLTKPFQVSDIETLIMEHFHRHEDATH